MTRHSIPRGLVLSLLVSAPLFAGACTESTQPHGPQKIGYSGHAQLEKITEAIHRAGRKTQWMTRDMRPGLIEAKREWGGGKHNIVVDVIYDEKTFRIVHKSSKNLRYSGTRAHRAYNEQINAFEQAIKNETWNF